SVDAPGAIFARCRPNAATLAADISLETAALGVAGKSLLRKVQEHRARRNRDREDRTSHPGNRWSFPRWFHRDLHLSGFAYKPLLRRPDLKPTASATTTGSHDRLEPQIAQGEGPACALELRHRRRRWRLDDAGPQRPIASDRVSPPAD